MMDGFNNALTESENALYKSELHHNPAARADQGGHWQELDDLELTTYLQVS